MPELVAHPDLTFTPDESGDTIEVEGVTEAGIEFLDAWGGDILVVLDSGRILVEKEHGRPLYYAAKERHLTANFEVE